MMKSLLALLLCLPMALPQEKPAVVTGTVTFDGNIPKPKLNKEVMKDPGCANCHAVAPPKEDLVVDASGGVRWAVVYVRKGLPDGKTFEPPAEGVMIDQVGCTYVPHVAAAMVGQKVTFRNGDPFIHNVQGLPFTNRGFNYGQPTKGSSNDIRFTAQEVPVKVVCNVHPFMAMYVCVLDHPFFAVTDATGKFELKNLPPGKYTLGVWHEKVKGDDLEIEVKGDLKVDFKVK
jgi:plastocyanin